MSEASGFWVPFLLWMAYLEQALLIARWQRVYYSSIDEHGTESEPKAVLRTAKTQLWGVSS